MKEIKREAIQKATHTKNGVTELPSQNIKSIVKALINLEVLRAKHLGRLPVDDEHKPKKDEISN